MAAYKIIVARSARKYLQSLPMNAAERILTNIEALEANPRPYRCKKLSGTANLWRLRVGDYRVIYKIDDKNQKVDISVIRHRSEAYR